VRTGGRDYVGFAPIKTLIGVFHWFLERRGRGKAQGTCSIHSKPTARGPQIPSRVELFGLPGILV